ncbi:sensor histidine kinase [Paenibacillus sp. strain BS8-2]
MNRFIPGSLKYRLFLAFMLFIFVPLTALSLYVFQMIENSMQEQLIAKNQQEIEDMNASLDELMSVVMKAFILLEKDSGIVRLFRSPEEVHALDRQHLLEEKMNTIDNTLFLYHSPQVHYTLADYHRHIYTSYLPRERLDYDDFLSDARSKMSPSSPYQWVTNEKNYVLSDHSSSPRLLSLIAHLREPSGDSYGLARISIDYTLWFNSMTERSHLPQAYYILDRNGTTILQSDVQQPISTYTVTRMLEGDRSTGRSVSFIDPEASTIVTFSYVPALNWFIANSVSQEVLFRDVQRLKEQAFTVFLFIVLLFVGITLFISSSITRPLQTLRNKMTDVVDKNLKVNVPEHGYQGEILELTRAFNRMILDMNGMVHKLKLEQVQREAVRFQMLLSQMNPHFLFNTLNTVKFIAMRKQDDDIVEICISLGKLLETSLNTDIELIHLSDEMKLIEAYVSIQKFRYNNQFQIEYDVPDELVYSLVPKLSLQPLVENSIYHGIANLDGDGRITIRVYAARERLHIEVEDNGVSAERSGDGRQMRSRTGIGLTNLRERLGILFRSEGGLELTTRESGTIVSLYLPLLLSTPYKEGDEDGLDRIAR